MALTEQHRNALYQGLTDAVGDEEAVAAMLSQFPAREVDEPATKELVRAEVSRLDAKMDVGFAECRAEIAAVEHRLSERITQTASDIMDFVHRELRIYFLWSHGAMFVLLAAVVTAAKILQ